jgi:proline dehydrogenase
MLFRRVMLGILEHPAAREFARRYGLALGASRFVAGETMEEALEAARRLNERGFLVTLDYLGEAVREGARVEEAVVTYRTLLSAMARAGIRGDVSLKLTQLGLALGLDRAEEAVREIASLAREAGTSVWIDMESSAYTEGILEVYRRVRAEYPETGVALQAYLLRTEADLRSLTGPGVRVRICKGAYAEPPGVAFQRREEVEENFRRLLLIHLQAGGYAAVATHDENLVHYALSLLEREKAAGAMEFQMLYGIRLDLQERLLSQGLRVRIYTPFGREWYLYFARRLAERPANLAFVVRQLLREWGGG